MMTQLFKWCSKTSTGKNFILIFTTDAYTNMIMKCEEDEFEALTKRLNITATLKDNVDVHIEVVRKDDIHHIWSQIVCYHANMGIPLHKHTKSFTDES